MHLTCNILLVLIVCIVSFNKCNAEYEIPIPTIEAFTPKGFRVSIPDSPDLQFFAIHINVNEPISSLSAGEYSGEVRKAQNGRWTYEHNTVALQPGDVLHYWIFVQRGKLGYRRDEEKYSITRLTTRNAVTDPKPVENQCISTVTTINGGQSTCRGKLIFLEEFGGESLDETLWAHDCVMPSDEEDNEFTSYRAQPENIFLDKGSLNIWPTTVKDAETVQNGELNLTKLCGCSSNRADDCYRKAMSFNILQPVVSASVRSKTSFRYGRIEIRAKLPSGDWLYPILNLESRNNEYGQGYKSGRMRIAFARGNRILTSSSGQDIGAKELSGGLLLGQFTPARNHSTRSKLGDTPWTSDFHTYEIIWSPNDVQLKVDGETYGTITPPSNGFKSLDLDYAKTWKDSDMSPFDKEMVIRIGLACGGVTDFPDDISTQDSSGPPHPKPWRNLDPKAMLRFWRDTAWQPTWTREASTFQIEYVKVWAL